MHHSSKTFGLLLSLLLAVCLFGHIAQAKYGSSGMAASGETSTYVFVPDQSTVVQTGGIAGVPRTYSVKGEFQLTVDPNAGTALFAHVDANATDDSPFKHTLDLNHVFNMTSLLGTVEPSGSLKFTGKAPDDSDILITVTLQDGLAHLIGQTTPPPDSADFFIFNLDAVAQRKYSGGSGTAEDPYQIATAADLIALGETPADYDKHFILTADIDLDPNLPEGKVFDKAVIAPETGGTAGWPFDGTPFTGVFDGCGHAISHLKIAGGSYLGLFGQVGGRDAPGGEVKNLGLDGVNITGSGYSVGALVGSNEWSGAVTNCYSSGAVRGDLSVGGLVGENRGSITASYSIGTVSSTSSVGGLVGSNAGGRITNSYATGSVAGDSSVGGLAGTNGYGCETRSQCAGSVISDCYSAGAVNGAEDVGGLLGRAGLGAVTACFWDIQTSGQTTSDGGTAKTTAEMKMAKTFLDAGWDFVNIWGIGENQTYPYLRKYSAVDINQDDSVDFFDLAALAGNWLTSLSP